MDKELVQAYIIKTIKEEVASIFDSLGLSEPEGIQLLYEQATWHNSHSFKLDSVSDFANGNAESPIGVDEEQLIENIISIYDDILDSEPPMDRIPELIEKILASMQRR